jgi:hypothetical protein
MPAEFLAKHIPILVGMSQAVAFAHSRGIIHRDLKPAQVMVGEFDEVLLMDWGLAITFDEARVTAYGGSNYTGLMPTTETASNPAGTVAYMAPEQTESEANLLGPWTDVYLLGATLYQVLTGKVPHPGSRIEAFKHAQAGRVFPAEIAAPDRPLPDELVALMNHSMEPDYRRRTLTATDFVNRLKAWLARSNQRLEGLTLREQVTKNVRRLTDESDYRDFTEQLVLLRRLQYLLPDDPRVVELETDLAARFATVAARRGDIGLARLQAGLVPDERRRDVVMLEVERRAKKQEVHQRQRRVFLGGFIALVVIALTSIAYFTSLVYAQQREQLRVAGERDEFNRQERYRKRELDALRALASMANDRAPLEAFLAQSSVLIRNGLAVPGAAEVRFISGADVAAAQSALGEAGHWMREVSAPGGYHLSVRPSRDAAEEARTATTSQEQDFLQAAMDTVGAGIRARSAPGGS